MGIETVIGGALGLGGALLQSKGSRDASKAAAASADAATQAQLEMYQQTRADQAPWRETGARALGTLEGKVNAGPGEFIPEQEPGYRFGYEEFVEKPTLRTAAATGMAQSGRALKSLARYASDYASTKYDNFLDRYYKSLDPYYRMAGLGSNVAISGGQQATSTGQGIANTALAGGQARASGYLNQGNIWGTAASQTGQNLLDYFNYNKDYWGNTIAGSAGGANSMSWL